MDLRVAPGMANVAVPSSLEALATISRALWLLAQSIR